MLSKSKYCTGYQCLKYLWLDMYKKEVKELIDNSTILENGTRVGKVAKNYFGDHIDIEFNSNLITMVSDTQKALQNENVVVTEASFIYNGNFCSVDILRKVGNDYYMYEVKSSTSVTPIYLEDVSYQLYVLRNCGLNVKGVYILYINNQYVRNGKLELDKLFNCKDVTEYAFERQTFVTNKINSINDILSKDFEPNRDIGEYCHKPYDCPYFKYCTRNLPENNIFKLAKMSFNDKVKFYRKGIITLEQLLDENIKEEYKTQIKFELYNLEDYYNKENIDKFLDTLTYPLYFLDFETCQEAIPSINGCNPYKQIPFQYSLHIMDNEGNLKHKEFLADGRRDPRKQLAEKLIKDIPMNKCVLAYNMAFEKSVIKYLAESFPEYSEHLMNIHDNIKDLIVPFKGMDYYSRDMHGSFSIKHVLPSLFPNDPSLNYTNLDMVHNGSEAANSYLLLQTLKDEEYNELRKNMLKYCELDTYAMVKIYQKLKKLK